MVTGLRGRAAFTLLEVIVSLCILAVGIASIFALFPIGIYNLKETVEDTRSSMLGATARSELIAKQVHMSVVNAGSRYFDGEWCSAPAGPFHYPLDMRYFTEPIYEYQDAAGDTHMRVVFDDRTMVPIRLSGAPDGSRTVAVSAASVTREAQMLFYFLTGTDFAPWQITLRVLGRCYVLESATLDGVTPTAFTVAAGGPALPDLGGQEVPMEVLAPVAMKEPPVDVPLVWPCGAADFASGSPFALQHGADSRTLVSCLCAGGWISVDGDWYRLTSVTEDEITLDGSGGLPAGPATRFDIVLPVVDFASAAFSDNGAGADDDTLLLPLVFSASRLAGTGAQMGFIESGASVEIVLDGARADFDPANALDRRSVINVTNLSPAAEALITPGNFIRINGRDHEIESSYDSVTRSFNLVGTVPGLGSSCYFNIVLGYDATVGQAPQVARFPVRRVGRQAGDATTYEGRPVLGFEVGRDTNGNLPDDLLPAGFSETAPVRVLASNRSQYCWQASFEQKTIVGNFKRSSRWVEAPNEVSPSPESPPLAPVPFPVDTSLYPLFNPIHVSPYRIFVAPMGKELNPNWMSNYAVKRDIVSIEGGGTRLEIHPNPPFTGDNIPFYIWDQNVFGDALPVGDGTYEEATDRVYFTSLNENAVFMAPEVNITVSWPGRDVVFELDYGFDPTLGYFEIPSSHTPADGQTVSIAITASADIGPPDGNRPRGRGHFVTGSNIVMAVYPNLWPGFTVPGKGFPGSSQAPGRCSIEVGDYIESPDGDDWYTVVAVRNNGAAGTDFLVLDRPYTGATDDDFAFCYVSPLNKTFTAHISVFRNYRAKPLADLAAAGGTAGEAAAFGYDSNGDEEARKVQLAAPLPARVKPGDYIRSEGDMATETKTPSDMGMAVLIEPGLGDNVDGDLCWYMIESISDDRLELTLTSPYRGHIQENDPPPGQEKPRGIFQPASVTSAVVRRFDTILGGV